ncbi:MAG: hypothetical protein AB8G96_10245 [Phycisphaerales bacterium]
MFAAPIVARPAPASSLRPGRAAMRRLLRLPLVLSALALGGCGYGTRSQPQFVPEDVPVRGAVNGRPTLGMPIDVPGTDVDLNLVPYAIERERRWLETSDAPGASAGWASASLRLSVERSFDGRSSPFAIVQPVEWHNVLLQRIGAGSGGPLLNRRGLIVKWGVAGPRDDAGSRRTSHLVFHVVETDANGDGRLGRGDPAGVLLVDVATARAHRLTPSNGWVDAMRWDDASGRLILMLAVDSDGNGQLTGADDRRPYVATPGSGQLAVPLVDDAMLHRLGRGLGGGPIVP